MKCYRSDYFHTNLVECGNIGRLAFLDAEKYMATIRDLALESTSPHGSISYIITLLQNPDKSKQSLCQELEVVKRDAKTGLDAARKLGERFRYWYLFIQALERVCSIIKSTCKASHLTEYR